MVSNPTESAPMPALSHVGTFLSSRTVEMTRPSTSLQDASFQYFHWALVLVGHLSLLSVYANPKH